MPVPPPPPSTNLSFEPMTRFSKLNTSIWILLTLTAGLGACHAIFAFMRSINAISLAERYSTNAYDSASTFQQLSAISMGFNFYIGVALFVLLIIYTYRFANKLKKTGHKVRLPIGLAIGGWFIPLANSVLSFLFFIDFINTEKSSRSKNLILLNVWWWGWLVGTNLGALTGATVMQVRYYTWQNSTVIFSFINSVAVSLAVGGTVCGVLFFRELRKVEMNLRPEISQ